MLTAVAVLFAGLAFTTAPSVAEEVTPWIQSDKEDYPPGGLVQLTGGGWLPGESVHINVDDDQTKTWQRNVDVVADESGTITDSFNLPDWFVATYQVVATGESSGVATTMFTDGNVQVETSGPSVTLQYTQFTGLNCTPDPGTAGSATVSSSTGNDNVFGRNTGSFRLQVPATTTAGLVFSHWTSSSNFDSPDNPLCFNAVNGNRTFKAHYVAQTITTTTLTASSAAGTFGGAVNLSATLTAGSSGVANKSITFELNGTSVGSDTTDASGVATLNNVPLAGIDAGSYPAGVKASFAGDTTHASANSTSSLTVQKANQGTLTVTGPDSGAYGQELTITASGGSGTGALSFAATGTACTVAGNQLTITSGTGTCSVTATKAGDTNYNATTSAAKTVAIGKATQAALTVTGPDSGAYGQELTITASGGSGTGALSFAATGTACTVAGNQLTITSGTGTCSITATKAGDTNYAAGTSDAHPVAVSKASANMSLSGLGGNVYNGEPHTAVITTDPNGLSGVTVTYDGDTAAPVDAGTYSVVATLDHPNYAAQSATGTLVITAKELTGSFEVDDKDYDGTTAADVKPDSRDLDGVVGTEDVTLTGGTATFASKDVGTHAVTGTGFTLGGTDKDNYTLGPVTAPNATITAKVVTGSFTAANKFYDGTTAATILTRSIPAKVAGDAVDLVGGTAAFDTASPGLGKTVTGTGFALSGDDADNYELASSTLTTTANITFGSVSGFYAPVDMTPLASTKPVYNTIKAGSTVPLKFEVFAQLFRMNEIKSVETIGAKLSQSKTSCENGAEEAVIEAPATGSTALRFDTGGDQFIYNWKTPTTKGCYTVRVALADSSTIQAHFMLK